MIKFKLSGGPAAWVIDAYLESDSTPSVTGRYRAPSRLQPEKYGVSWASLGEVSLDRADLFASAVTRMRDIVVAASYCVGDGKFMVSSRRIPDRDKIGVTISWGALSAEFGAGVIGDSIEVVRQGDAVDIPLDEDLLAEIAPGILASDEGFASLWYDWAKQQAKIYLYQQPRDMIRAIFEGRSVELDHVS